MNNASFAIGLRQLLTSSLPYRGLLGGALLVMIEFMVAPGASAQPFEDRPLPTKGRTVTLSIRSNQEFLRSAANTAHYAPMLDMRRRILANAWAWGADLRGPANGLSLSEDLCRENGAGPIAGHCTPVPAGDIDRLEVAWFKSGFGGEALDVVFSSMFNSNTMPREFLRLPTWGGEYTLHWPGMVFRFVSGPAAAYDGKVRWSTLSPTPTGESTGFEVDRIVLRSSEPPMRGDGTAPALLAPYERATIVLLGGSIGHDSVTFAIDPQIQRPTVAAWVDGPGSLKFFYRCGMPPTQTSQDYLDIQTADVLDLTEGCSTMWYVTAVNAGPDDAVAHVRVGALAGPNRNFDLVVGLEYSATPTEIGYVRRVLRESAWLFYGVTGGSHMIRTYTYLAPGNCNGAHICWRNTTACSQGAATTHPTGSTPSLAIDICRNLTGLSAANPPGDDGMGMAHEFGHLLTANGTLNHLGDEYWYSHSTAGICGESGVYIHRCAHSMMAQLPTYMVSLCTARTHNAATQVMRQHAAGNYQTIGLRSVGWSTPTTTVTECLQGTNYAGTYGSAAWDVLANSGAASHAHPSWSPDNHDFRNFANNGSVVIGQNL